MKTRPTRNQVARARPTPPPVILLLCAALSAGCGNRNNDELPDGFTGDLVDVVNHDVRLAVDATETVDAGAGVTPVDAGGPECVVDSDCPGDQWPCMTPICHPDLGCLLSPRPDGIACDDLNPCTHGGVCKSGDCRYATPKNCDDPNPCTFDWCREGDGKCMHTATVNGAACLHTDACVAAASCQKGQCKPKGPSWCDCKKDKDCVKFDDGDLCNGVQYCDLAHFPYLCKAKAGSTVTCPKDSDTTCAKAACNPDTGKCFAQKVLEGTDCDDGKACTTGEYCNDGSCTPVKDNCGG